MQLAPVQDAVQQLADRGWVRWKSEPLGDCSLLSIMAGKEIKEPGQVHIMLIAS